MLFGNEFLTKEAQWEEETSKERPFTSSVLRLNQGVVFISRTRVSDTHSKMQTRSYGESKTLLSVSVLLLLLTFPRATLARVIGHQETQVMLLRPVLVPLMSREQAEDAVASTIRKISQQNRVDLSLLPPPATTYSPNNRGFQTQRPTFRFGERTSPIETLKQQHQQRQEHPSIANTGPAMEVKQENQIVWSQPDPRKTYSLPLNLIDLARRSSINQRARKLAGVSAHKAAALPALTQRRSSNYLNNKFDGNELSVGSDTNSSSTQSSLVQQLPVPTTTIIPNAANSASEDELYQTWKVEQTLDTSETTTSNGGERDSRGKVHKLQHHQLQPANLVTLIKYVPILMSLPTEHLAVLPLRANKLGGPHRRPTNNNRKGSAASRGGDSSVSSSNLLDDSAASAKLSTTTPTYLGLYRQQAQQQQVKYHQQLTTAAQDDIQRLPQSAFGNEEAQSANWNYVSAINGGDFSGMDAPEYSHYLPAGGYVIRPAKQQAMLSTTLIDGASYSVGIPAQVGTSSGANVHPVVAPTTASLSAPALATPPMATSTTKLAYIQTNPTILAQSAPQLSQAGATSKALSAYASKLISMLRPSSLLSSIHGGQLHQQTPGLYPLPSQAQIYLLTPAEGFVPTTSPQTRYPQQQPAHYYSPTTTTSSTTTKPQQAVKPEDLLLNQSSKVHSTASTAKMTAGASSWLHQQPNGLICVHSVIQPNPKLGYSPGSQHLSADYNASGLQQQQLLGDQSSGTQAPLIDNTNSNVDNDSGSFDYVVASSTTESSAPTTKQLQPPSYQQTQSSLGIKQSLKRPSQQQQYAFGRKESPIKLAKKLNKKSYAKQATTIASTDGYDDEDTQRIVPPSPGKSGDSAFSDTHQLQDGESPRHQQQRQRLLGLQSESRSAVSASEPNELSSSSAQTQPKLTSLVESNFSNSRRYGNGTFRSIIPFTIKDKIDLPVRRRPAAINPGGHNSHQRQQQQQPQMMDYGQLVSSTNSPVQFDDPTDSELELRDKQFQLVNQQNSWSSDSERRVKTSFIAKSGSGRNLSNKQRKLGSANADIDYKREAGISLNGYTLPLLIASSSPRTNKKTKDAEGQSVRLSDDGQTSGSEQQSVELLPAFMRPSVVFGTPRPLPGASSPPPPSTTTSAPQLEDESPSVASSGTLDVQPATLLNRPLRLKDSVNRRLSGVSYPSSRVEESRSTPLSLSSSSRTPVSTRAPVNLADAIEFVVNSTPDITSTTMIPATQGPSTTTVAQHLQANTTNQPELEPIADSEPTSTSQPTLTPSNRTLEDGNNNIGSGSFSNDRLLSNAGSLEEFGRISESLQTNPLDLVDLQNSRSNFELPSQLESLSMLYSSRPEAHQQQVNENDAADDSSEKEKPPRPSGWRSVNKQT